MKNIFNKTNAPYLVSGALATLALVSSGVVGVLTAVAVFNASLPLVASLVGFAVFSAATIALSAVVISKNNTISEKDNKIFSLEKQLDEDEQFYDAVDVQEERQKKFENRVAARKKEEANEMAELKAKGLLPDTIELPDKETETSSPENQQAKGENGQGWGAWGLDKAKTAVRLAVGAAIFTAAVASNFVGTLFTESDVSPVGGMSSNINGTYSDHSR